VLLNIPEPQIRAALSPQSILVKSGLISIDRGNSRFLRGRLDLLSDGFADMMRTGMTDPIELLRGTVTLLPHGELGLEDYEHIRSSLDILLPHLRHALASRRQGVNVFLYGLPGTGKSELARVLAKELGCQAFDVAREDENGNPVNGERRLRALRAAQAFFAQHRALMVFDEAEDVFNDGEEPFGRGSTARQRKAWMNRMLEENPAPTLWLSNTLRGLDRAFIRRFDMVFELPVPPRRQRERILQTYCRDLVEARQIARIAEVDNLAPAIVAKASSIVRPIRDELGRDKTASALEHLVSSTLEAQGFRPILQNDPNRLPEVYDPAFINADADLAEVAQGLSVAKSGRLCLYGPPGTGKTAFGRWLAQRLDAPLLVKRASDLLSMWVGETERNIARAFRQAQSEGAVLLIDEVDGFLQDRRGARSDWEVTLVNEMLTQMESFPGVFVASTNLMSGLDQAALRRFDLKVKFDFLRPDQAWELLCRHCLSLGLGMPSVEMQSRLTRLDRLTPGDFAAVLRQHRFRPLQSVAALVAALEGECALKEGASRPIGFM
jgi:SpoVK/Ycf46/Vps4 family AAA+-type ATPase